VIAAALHGWLLFMIICIIESRTKGTDIGASDNVHHSLIKNASTKE